MGSIKGQKHNPYIEGKYAHLNPNDVVFTPDWLAKQICGMFAIDGKVLEPCKGEGAFLKYLPDEQVITPFGTFSFYSFEKVDSLPENAVKSTEERYNIWYLQDPEKDDQAEDFESYLMDWRVCETNIQKRLWRIELENKNP